MRWQSSAPPALGTTASRSNLSPYPTTIRHIQHARARAQQPVTLPTKHAKVGPHGSQIGRSGGRSVLDAPNLAGIMWTAFDHHQAPLTNGELRRDLRDRAATLCRRHCRTDHTSVGKGLPTSVRQRPDNFPKRGGSGRLDTVPLPRTSPFQVTCLVLSPRWSRRPRSPRLPAPGPSP